MKVCNEQLRPEVPEAVAVAGVGDLMVACWGGAPAERPSFEVVAGALAVGRWGEKPML
jgi:hypothetical protein